MLDAALRRLSPKSDMAKAIAYGTKRWPALCRFLDDGRLEIDNNIAERALSQHRCRSPQLAVRRLQGRRLSAQPQSSPSSRPARPTNVDPQAYIADVIAKIADDWPATRWDDLMPWNWRAETDQDIAQAA